ncbi:MAG: PTS lactose/cellobiose transporter subunit IIA [Spirochaetaceae bacterium]|jgi:PTS system cellobiose-specific IIA component|nr:PTS lactose/cellobiose transporter subunit IIA [Spirochaetaceae bacterium]
MNFEEQAMRLIVSAGNAKSAAMNAIAQAKQGNWDGVRAALAESEAAMTAAHKEQTDILQRSLDEPDKGMGMLMVHAQDHLMTAITVIDLAREFCMLYEIIGKQGDVKCE